MKFNQNIHIMLIALFGLMMTSVFADEPARDGVFVHVSSGPDHPHRLLMALNMANMMAEDHAVLVYFDIDAVLAVVQDAPDVEFEPFPPLRELLAALLEKNVTLMACPGCLRAANQSPEDVIDGIQLADRTQFLSFADGRILSFSY